MPESEHSSLTPGWEYFHRARRGDDRAWRVLIKEHRARLGALALLITGSDAAADDVVQETFIRALRADIGHHQGTVGGYLGTIAYRLAVKETERSRRNVKLDGQDPQDHRQNALERILADERDRLVVEVIRALSAEHRDVLVLRFYGSHSYEEIAELVRAPLGTVKSRIFYAVKSCRQMLRQKGILE
ncbi:MAG: RNA polymerase sigma factor [Candidatus Zixiibacteriota bacterium]